ncbi:MAG: hypothetical protein ABIC36_03500 [bacterium]
MTKKYIFIIVVMIILVVGAFWVSKQTDFDEEEQIKDDIVVLLESLEKTSSIDFSDIQGIELKWNVEKEQGIEEISIDGNGFEVNSITGEQYQKIEMFFEEQNFDIDLYNVADGIFGSLIGYRKDQIVCVVVGVSQLDEQGLPLEEDKRDAEVYCGKTDENLDHFVSKEEEIKMLFAEKYNTKVSAVEISISKEAENHIKGEVEILDEELEGAGNVGIFLVAKVDNVWELVFDGNGTFSCETLKDFDFPEDIQEGCVEE